MFCPCHILCSVQEKRKIRRNHWNLPINTWGMSDYYPATKLQRERDKLEPISAAWPSSPSLGRTFETNSDKEHSEERRRRPSWGFYHVGFWKLIIFLGLELLIIRNLCWHLESNVLNKFLFIILPKFIKPVKPFEARRPVLILLNIKLFIVLNNDFPYISESESSKFSLVLV